MVWCLLKTPTGRPYPPAAQAGPEGLGCIRRCVGGGWCGVSSKPPRGVPIPPRPRQDRRDSGASAAVWGWVVWCLLKTPTARPVGSGYVERTELGLGEARYPLSVTYGSRHYLLR